LTRDSHQSAPWREARRKAQRQHLGVLGGMVAVLGLLLRRRGAPDYCGYIAVQQRTATNFLKRENVRLDQAKSRDQKAEERYCSAPCAQADHRAAASGPCAGPSTCCRSCSAGTRWRYLKAIKQTGLKINMVGYAQSNARVSTLMRNFAASPYLENPDLVEIRA